MDFRIADTLTNSLAKLTCKEQKAVKTTAFDLLAPVRETEERADRGESHQPPGG